MNKSDTIFAIKDIHVEVEGKEVVKGVSLDIKRGPQSRPETAAVKRC